MLNLNLGFAFDGRLGLVLRVIKLLDLYMFPGCRTARLALAIPVVTF